MKNVMMVVMFLFTMLAGGMDSFAEEAKAPAAPAAVVAPAPKEEAAKSAVVIPMNGAPEVVKSEAAAQAAMEPKSEEQKVEEITEPPQWLKNAIGIALKMPYIGPILVTVMQWMGVLAALLTALSGLLLALMKISDKLGKSIAFFTKLQGWLNKIYPWVAWLSMFNVPKDGKEEKDKKAA